MREILYEKKEEKLANEIIYDAEQKKISSQNEHSQNDHTLLVENKIS